MTTDQAVTALLDLIHSDVLQSDGETWERLTEANDKAYALSSGEQALVELATAIWAAAGPRGSIALLGVLDKANRLNALAIITEHYGAMG